MSTSRVVFFNIQIIHSAIDNVELSTYSMARRCVFLVYLLVLLENQDVPLNISQFGRILVPLLD